MVNLFQFASNDQSLIYLASIFGNMSGVIPAPGGPYAILGAMFKVFNSMVLAIGALVILYVTIMSVVMTAHEGEFMGKKWNNIWIFIRIVFAVALMIPSASGYCAIQFIMMWIIVQGVGAADSVWNAALDYVNTFGSIYTQTSVPTTGTFANFPGLFQAIVCDQTARMSQPAPTNYQGGNYYCASNQGGGGFCGGSIPQVTANSNQISFGPGGGVGNLSGACGGITYCNATQACATDANSLNCKVCQAQVHALNTTIQVFSTIAQQFAQADYQYRSFYARSARTLDTSQWPFVGQYCQEQGIPPNECCVYPPNKAAQNDPTVICSPNTHFKQFSDNDDKNPQNLAPSTVSAIIWKYAFSSLQGENFINTLVNENYTLAISAAVKEWNDAQGNPAPTTGLQGPLADAQKTGWITAGGFYYMLASQNNKVAESASPILNFNSANPDINSTGNSLYNYRNNYNAAGQLLNAAGSSSGSAYSSNPQLSSISGTMGNSSNDIGNAFTQGTSPDIGGNPLAKLQMIGKILLIVAEITFAVLVVATFAFGILGNAFDIWALGNGVINPVGPALILMYMVFVPLILAFLGILVTYGGLLAVYVPLIPYIIFTVSVIAWFISVVEAMVAGPLVALGMLSPNTQHHEIMGKSEAALGHILSIFLRPALMIFGLIAALLVSTAVVALINQGFWQIRDSTGVKYDPLANILFLGAYIGFVVSALNKSFALIHIVPQQVLTWMGIHHQGVGGGAEPGEALQGAKAGGEQAGGYAAAGMKGAQPQISGAISGARKQYDDRAAKTKGQGEIDITGSQEPGGKGKG